MRGANPTFVLCYPALPPQDWNRWKSQALGEIWIQVLLVLRHVLYLGAATIFHVPSLNCIITTSSVFVWISFLRRWLNLFGSCWHWTRRACATLHQLCHRHIAYFKVRVYLESLHPARFFWPNLSLQRTSWRRIKWMMSFQPFRNDSNVESKGERLRKTKEMQEKAPSFQIEPS